MRYPSIAYAWSMFFGIALLILFVEALSSSRLSIASRTAFFVTGASLCIACWYFGLRVIKRLK